MLPAVRGRSVPRLGRSGTPPAACLAPRSDAVGPPERGGTVLRAEDFTGADGAEHRRPRRGLGTAVARSGAVQSKLARPPYLHGAMATNPSLPSPHP